MATTFQQVSNNSSGILNTTMNASVTSVVLGSGQGALFPSSGSFHVSIDTEILICTSRSSDTLTVSRGAESTTAAIHPAGATVALNIISKHISDLNTAVNAVETILATSGGLRGNLSDETGSGGAVFATGPTLASPVLNTGVSGSAVLDEDNMASNSATKIATQQSIKAYVDAVATASDLDFQGDSGGALSIDLDSETLDIAGGTGIDTVGNTNTLTVAIDSTVATLVGSQVLTNKTLTAPTINGAVGGTQTSATITALTISSMAGNWTNAGRTVADMGTVTTIDIDGGTINGITDLAVVDGGTGASTLNNLITMGTHTTGNYVATVTAGTGLTSNGATSGESVTHSLSVDASQGQITTVGALNAGSIDTSFGTINNAAAITGTVLTATTNFTMGDTVITNGVITDTSGLSLAADVTVTGDLIVSGDTITVNTSTVSIEDSMLLLANNQGTSADAVDFGLYGKYGVSGTTKYAGIFRDQDVTGDPWTFFDNNSAEPTTTVNVGGTGYDLADISAGGITAADGFTGDITGDVTGNADTVTTNANLTGHVVSSGNAATLGSFTSAHLLGALTNETGTGVAVFNTSPTLVTPALGTPASGVMTNMTGAVTASILDNQVTVAKLVDLARGSLIIGNASAASTELTKGADGYVLTSDGDDIAWVQPTVGDITGITTGDGLSGGATTGTPSLAVDLVSNGGLEFASGELQVASGIAQHDIAQYAASVADNDFLRIDGTKVEGLSAAEVAAAIEGSIDAVGTIASGTWQATDVGVGYGGTGVSTHTNHGVLLGQAGANIVATSAGTSGEVLISGGSGADPDWGDAPAASGAQTGITSVINAALALGRDADNQIKFATDDQIIFEVAGGDGVTFKATGEIEATSLDISGNVDIDGVLETDNLTVGGAQGSDGQVLTSTGSGVAWEAAGGGSNVQEFTSSGDWDATVSGTMVMVEVFGAGAGGASAEVDASGQYMLGGGSGGGGASSTFFFAKGDLDDTAESIVIGAGGAGGAANTADDTDGAVGSAGGDTYFSSAVVANVTGTGAGTSFNYGSGTSQMANGSHYNTGLSHMSSYGEGSGSSNRVGGYSGTVSGAGGAGSSIYSSDTIYTAGAGGRKNTTLVDGGESSYSYRGPKGGGGAAGTSGGAGANGSNPGDGGGGGHGSTSGNGGAGGNGANGGDSAAGGGGGGAGCCLNGSDTGKGGDGGNGFVRVTTW